MVARLAAASGASAGGIRYGLRVGSILGRRPSGVRGPLAVSLAAGCIATILFEHPGPQWAFALVLAAAVLLWISELFSWAVVSLGLVTLWIVTGVATPARAVGGFGSMDWMFVVALFGIASAVARSGLLLRVGLALVRRMPGSVLGCAVALMLTGVILCPLLPMVMGRAALTAPLALAVADALRLRSRDPAAALIGLATWIGCGPLVFMFLNASPLVLLTWGLLPEASRARSDWVHWLLAALPLGLFMAVGGLATLYLILRPGGAASLAPAHLDLQLAVLGRPTRRELAMIAVLLLTVAGWIAAPTLHLEVGTVALLGLIGAVLTGSFDRRSLQELDWDYLIFYGVALTLSQLMAALGLDQLVAGVAGDQIARLGVGALPFVLGVALLTILVRLVLLPEPAVLLVSLTVIPIAPTAGVDPWVAVIAVLSCFLLWYLPSQSPEYLIAYSGSEGRLYSHAQARRVGIAYAAVTLVGLALSIPYWRLLGLL